MKKFYILEGLTVSVDQDTVMRAIDCKEDSPIYDEMIQEYEELLPQIIPKAKPVGIIGFGELPDLGAECVYPAGTKVIYAVTSIGDGIRQCGSQGFADGDYVKGMLCETIADAALFSLENQIQERLKTICADAKVGIVQRMEAPYHLPMQVQHAAWEVLELEKRFGIGISSGYMFDPVKTVCQVYILTEDTSVFKAQHDCRNCPNVSCRMRKIPAPLITVQRGSKTTEFELNPSESLMDGLLREGCYISAVCGGKGRCGKCKVRVVSGTVPVTEADQKVFSETQLAEGWRLSCALYPQEAIAIAFEQNDESEFEAVGCYASAEIFDTEQNTAEDQKRTGYEIAIDIGTTTIAYELIEMADKKTLHTVTSVNSQRKYGADVIARIQAAADGKAEELQKCIRSDLQNGISMLLNERKIEMSEIRRIVISGNTTMGHLLMGYDCSGLGVYPFAPVNIDFIRGTIADILQIPGETEVVLLPGISTYVGADITSGMYACDFDKKEEIFLLVDLGTNGEMALGNKNRILVTSTAAGPAFEGGNIKWGMASVAGAICSVQLHGTDVGIRTIRDKEPVGICGTGVLETVAELLKEELVDETGLLEDDYFDDGFPLAKTADGEEIVFTQKDVREIQLAKAAVRAGVEILLLRYGIEKEQVEKVYLAGGFGYRLDTEKAIAIGMLPKEFAGRIFAVGNSSLAGAVRYIKEEKGEEVLEKLVAASEEIGLSSDQDFNDFYMDSMMFGLE